MEKLSCNVQVALQSYRTLQSKFTIEKIKKTKTKLKIEISELVSSIDLLEDKRNGYLRLIHDKKRESIQQHRIYKSDVLKPLGVGVYLIFSRLCSEDS